MKRLCLRVAKPCAVLVLLAGCASHYDPPARTDHAAPAYQADVASCRKSSAAAVDLNNSRTGLRWFASPFTRHFQVRAAVRACMTAKGYVIEG